MAKGKRGRPKKDPVYRDKGTPELQIKRMFIVKGGDPVNSSDPLDVCQERGIITSDMAKAGHDYARLYYRIIGKPDILDNNYKEKLRQGLKNLDQWFCKSNRKYRKKK
jgi:hypothetical protein